MTNHYSYQTPTDQFGRCFEVIISVWQGHEETLVTPESGGAFWETRTASRIRAKNLLSKGYKLIK